MKSILPRGLSGRTLLILIVPIVVIQLVVSVAFIQRHYEGVTRQMSQNILIELQDILAGAAPLSGPAAAAAAVSRAEALGMQARVPPRAPAPAASRIGRIDLSGKAMAEVLGAGLPGLEAVDLVGNPRMVQLWLLLPDGQSAEIVFERRRVSAANPHQLLAVMILASVLMTAVAYVFLRNQITPIKRLAQVAEAFGRGEVLPYRPRGASEVRAAGATFLAMRARIERQIESRTLMLSGVSHDLRAPLTRMKLALSFFPEDAETQALRRDVEDMERLVETFLAFARADTLEETAETDPAPLAGEVAERLRRMGATVTVALDPAPARPLRLRREAMLRALENLGSNAARHGTRVHLSLRETATSCIFCVEDDGPGIAPELRERALEPFQRLDEARDPNRGGGVGLGLSIALDVAHSHGGMLRLGSSEMLGGLKAEIILPRQSPG